MVAIVPVNIIKAKTKPTPGSLPLNKKINNDCYILYQPDPHHLPEELYHVKTWENVDTPYIQCVLKDDVAPLADKIFKKTDQTPMLFDHAYPLSDKQIKQIYAATGESNDSTEEDIQKLNCIRKDNNVIHSGNSIILDSHCFILHCNCYDDGLGDIGNVIDVANELLMNYGDNITLYFVFTSTAVRAKTNTDAFDKNILHFKNELTNLFKKYQTMNFDVRENVFTFVKESDPGSAYALTGEDKAYNKLIRNSKKLHRAYQIADAVFNIATPFPAMPLYLKLKDDAQIINITEHNAVSNMLGHYRESIPQLHYYVTGFSPDTSGIMVRDLACDLKGSVTALMEISDSDPGYIKQLGFSQPLNPVIAADFLNKTLIVPVYLGEKLKSDLVPVMVLISQSELGQKFDKIIFHVNGRSYDDTIFNEALKKFQDKFNFDLSKIQVIPGYFFNDAENLRRLYQLSSGRGVAVCSSDKALELTISCGLLPLYLPLAWKTGVYDDFAKLIAHKKDFAELHAIFEKPQSLIKDRKLILNTLLTDDGSHGYQFSHLLDQSVIDSWMNDVRPQLLNQSFYHVLDKNVFGNGLTVTTTLHVDANSTAASNNNDALLTKESAQTLKNFLFYEINRLDEKYGNDSLKAKQLGHIFDWLAMNFDVASAPHVQDLTDLIYSVCAIKQNPLGIYSPDSLSYFSNFCKKNHLAFSGEVFLEQDELSRLKSASRIDKMLRQISDKKDKPQDSCTLQ